MAATSHGAAGVQDGAPLRLTLTGAAACVQRAGASPLPLSRMDAALLAVLAVEGSASRQRLLQLLWPDQAPEQARNALRQRLFRLRRSAGAELVRGSEQLALADAVTHDLGADGDGELLASHDYADCPELDDWLAAQRRALRRRRRADAAARIAECERDARYADGAALADAQLAAEPLDEDLLRQAMRLHYLAGHRGAALTAYRRFADALADGDARAVPSAATRELLATIRDAPARVSAPRHEMPASVLRPPRLIGRDAALRALGVAWSASRAFWLLGEAGLGKSRLLAEFAGDPADGAALVVAARPGDGGVPYATLGRALRALLERRPALLERTPQRHELARVMPELDAVAVARSTAGAQIVLQRSIAALLRDAQCDGVAALVIDDLHWADSASLEMLQALACDDTLSSLRWGFAQRASDGAPAIDALRAALEELQRVDVLTLVPLTEAQMHELIASLGLPDIDAARLAGPLTRHTGGNPMYALETIKHLIASGQPLDARLPRPAGVGQLIERRLRQLPGEALALARVAAVAGIDFGIELAQAVLGTRALALADAWRELEAAQVLRGNAFAHDLVHEATLAGLPAPIAAHTHGEVAAYLEQHGGEPARVAAHWIAAQQSQRALAALHAAADAARHAMRRKEEAEFLERAAQIETEAGDPGTAFDSWHLMMQARWVAGLATLDDAMFDRLEALADGSRRRGVALQLRASWLQERGDLDGARRFALAAIDLAEMAGDESTAAEARQRLASLHDWKGEYDSALAMLQPLLPWAAERASDVSKAQLYCHMATLLDNVDRIREARVYHRHALDACRRAGEWGGAVTVLGNLAISWSTAGSVERAIELLREAMQLAAAHDEARGAGAVLPSEMFKALRDRGHYAEALGWADAAPTLAPGLRSAMLQCHVACGWLHLGQHARAQREIETALATPKPDWAHAKALQMSARLKLALAQRGAAATLEEALRLILALPGRRALRASIALDHALVLDPTDALAAVRDLIAEGERLDLAGTVLAGHIRAARFAANAQRAGDALAHARAVVAIGDDIAPNDIYPAERWLQAWRAFALAGADADAAAALQRGANWVRATARDHVPEPFRDSFVRANAVNQQLLRAAALQREA